MVEPVTILTGIALVKKSVDFIKTNIGTVQDIGDIIGHVDKALSGQQQVIKERDSKNVDHFAVENVAKEVIDAKLAQEQLYEMKQLIDHRFGHGTWSFILEERKKRLDKRKQAIKEERAKRQKQAQEIQEIVKYCGLGITVLGFVGLVIYIMVILMNPAKAADECQDFKTDVFICMNEGRGYADTELYLDYKRMRENWIVDDDKK